ncbi:PKD domain-containing protein [Chitinophaga niabensis]|uniref:Gliding motility-associated C-terminal domain-containing protein n=1 Tax=Chitinophaga niabensis TaxID=536979 RepID=A0A1N6DEU8_9BACT|nr:gliding motility-associated C-terminal domain-containing protein [Chitinophaga niabensis]SIN69298.1 gliding motility-associated C-terminal domain-containing protein [Chitinophaga niabensis]
MTLLSKWQRTILITCAFFIQQLAFAQELSNAGKEFWVAYGHHQFMEPGQSNSQEMVLRLTARQPATVTVSIYGTAWTRTYNIPANTTITTENIPKSGLYDARLYSVPPSFGGTGSEGIFTNKAIYISSNVPIVANAHIYGSASSGSTMLMPVESWGYTYTSLNSQQKYADNCFSWMYIIAKEPSTVEITPSVPTRNGRAAGVPYTVVLSKGHVYQVLGAGMGSGEGRDLTGTTVKSIGGASCPTVAVFSGSSRTYINCPAGSPASGDNIIQQVLPRQAWGMRYLTAPFSNSNLAASPQTNIYRVLVTDPATVVTWNGTPLTGLQQNTFYEFNSGTADLIEADKPVMVAQYMPSQGGCINISGDGDVEMTYVSPIDQGINRTFFSRTTSENINVQYLTLIIPAAGLSSLVIDGSNTFDHVYDHPQDAGYKVVVKRWTGANAYAEVSSDLPFVGTTYGLGSVESYGYNIGLHLNNLKGKGLIKNELNTAATSNEFTCRNTPFNMSVLLPYQPTRLVWKISDLAANITPNTDITDNAPVAAGTVTRNGVTYYQYTLAQVYRINIAPGTYTIHVLATHPDNDPCDKTEQYIIPVEVKDGPAAGMTVTRSSNCMMDTVYLSGKTTNNGFTIDRWQWTFPDGSVATDRETKKVFMPGSQQVKLQEISTEGCIVETIAPVAIVDRPTAGFTSSATALCPNAPITLTDNLSTYTGNTPIITRYWDFGNGTAHTVNVNDPQQPVYTAAGSYEVKMVTKVTALCISDTARATITVHPKPVVNIASNQLTTCTMDTVYLSGTANGGTPDQWTWTFADGSTATEQETKKILLPGNQQVKLEVSTTDGCSGDITVPITITDRPVASINASTPAVCEGGSVTFTDNVAAASPAQRYWSFGNGTGVTIGNNDPQSAAYPAYGSYEVKLVTKLSTLCISDTARTTMTVYAKPKINLTLPADCLPLNGTTAFQSNPVVPDGQAFNLYEWDFGDGSSMATGKDPVHQYAQGGTYPVQYKVYTSGGCSEDTTVNVAIRFKPQLTYGTIPPVCISAPGPVSVATALHTQPGTGIYSGVGVNALGSFDAATAGEGTHPVKYVFTTTAGCIDSVESSITVWPLPIADFMTSADTVCQQQTLTLTDRSIAAVRWSWDFGDGTTSAVASPGKQYTNTGLHDISLRTTDAQGCISAPSFHTVFVETQLVIDAGPSIVVPEGTVVPLQQAQANGTAGVTFRWSPAEDFVDPGMLNASLIARRDGVYTLTANSAYCTATDQMSVRVIKVINPPNAFSPNGDNINDTWVIADLALYPDAVVEVFNRYGQPVYRAAGYGTPWNGTFNGAPLPIGTYYYVIRLQPGTKPISGSVTILK